MRAWEYENIKTWEHENISAGGGRIWNLEFGIWNLKKFRGDPTSLKANSQRGRTSETRTWEHESMKTLEHGSMSWVLGSASWRRVIGIVYACR